MKRTELKRHTSLQATTFKAKRKSSLKQRCRMRRRSAKQETRLEGMDAFRDQVILLDRMVCRMCVLKTLKLITTNEPHEGLAYQKAKLEIHHITGRVGTRLQDIEHTVTLCTWHHLYSDKSPHGDPLGWKNDVLPLIEQWLIKRTEKIVEN